VNSETPKQFEEELEVFAERKDELLSLCEGKFAVFKGKEFAGVFDTPGAAYSEGVVRFGNVPFLIKPVLKDDRVESMPALHIGLSHACL
jgi:hypothetical protein